MRSILLKLLAGTVVLFSGFGMFSVAYATTLDDALRSALDNSLALEASRKSWLAAREDIGTSISTSEWRATGTLVGNQKMTDEAAAKKDGFLDSQSATATVSLTRNLYDGGQTTESSKLRQIQLEIAQANYLGVEQSVMLQVIEAYLGVVKASQEVRLNELNVTRLQEHVAAAKVRLDAGAATVTQVAQAEARLSRARTTLITAMTSLNNAEDNFSTLTGLAASDLDPAVEVGTLPSTLLEADEMARQDHPSVQSANLSVDAANQQFHSLLASVRPTVALSLNASENMAEGTRSDKTELSAQIRLSTPLMPSQSIRAKSRSLSASLQSTKYKRDDTLRQVSLNVRNAFRNLETARTQLTAVDAELEASRLVATGIRNEFQFGQKTTLDVLDAEQDVNDAEIRQISADHAIVLSAFRLRAATGQLTSDALGMSDVLGPLDDMQPLNPRFKSWVPLEVEWEDEAGTEVQETSTITPVVDQPAVVTPAPVMEIVENDVIAVPLAGDEADLTLANSAPLAPPVEGIVWQIQTNAIP